MRGDVVEVDADEAQPRRRAGIERVPGLRFLGPGTPGPRVAKVIAIALGGAITTANLVGAAAVYAFSAWGLPGTHIPHLGRFLFLNAMLTVAYLLFAIPVGIVWGVAWLRPTIDWIREDRVPDPKQARDALRGPRRLLIVQAVLWSIAVVVFTLFNGIQHPSLTGRACATVVLGGLSTCSLTYLLVERITRPIAARALAAGHGWPRLPGVTMRTLLAWMLGSALPVVGLMVTAITALAGKNATPDQLAVAMLALGGVALTTGFTMTFLGARAVSDPVRSVRAALTRVEQGDLDVHIPVYDGSELGRLQAGVNLMTAGLREREQLRDLFGRHVGEEVARDALERGPSLGGETSDAAVLFVDLIGSTQLAVRLPPEDVVALLNRFFAVVIEVVAEHGGAINKFAGDAALAVFGAPVAVDDHAGRALAAGRHLAERLPAEVPEIDAGIGVASGVVVAGNIGDPRRYEYTVIGDPVNVAARLTELAKAEPTRLLATADAVALAADTEAACWVSGEEVSLRGRTTPVRLARRKTT